MPYFERSDCKIYYEICGSGSPLVLLHGLGADNASWLTVRDLLAKKHTLIMPDNCLSGRSSCMNIAAVNIHTLAQDVKALLEYLGIKKAVICGHSMGGMVAMEFVLNFPEMTEKLILECTTAVSSKRNNELFSAWSDYINKEGYTEIMWRLMFAWMRSPSFYQNNPGNTESTIQFILKYPYMPKPANFERMTQLLSEYNCTDRLKNISVPCLVISGDEDILIAPDENRAIAAAIKNSRFVLLKNTGHNAHFESPDIFTSEILAFVS